MGVIRNPRVPLEKHLNLYQNGFVSVMGSLVQGLGNNLLPQRGTVVWLNVLVPQTGKAVDGFCPKVVQTCVIPAITQSKKLTNKTACFRPIPPEALVGIITLKK